MPELSIVIAVVHGPYCLDGIRTRCKGFDVEIVLVVKNPQWVIGRQDQVKRVLADPDSSERQMRLAGIEQASGNLIAILGDRYEPGDEWVRVALASGNQAISGSVLPPAALSPSGWAIYLAEYSYCAGPVEGNLVYPRLFGGPVDPAFRPELSVLFARPPGWRQYLAERYRDSREWARRHCSGESTLRRWGRAVSRICLLPLLMWRRARGRHPLRYIAALPYLLVSGCVEAAGEIAGFVAGEK